MTILLHGFWGQPRDWTQVISRLELGRTVWAPDLYEVAEFSPDQELGPWSDRFVEALGAFGPGPFQLVGYSMGGRLALAAIHKAPGLFSRALILSAAALVPTAADGEARRLWELDWQARFERDEWDKLEGAWQEQSVFTGSSVVPRRRRADLRGALGKSLLNWSPRQHPFGADWVRALPPAVEWAYGALDQKYLAVANSLRRLPVRGQISVLEGAGHRLPQDAPGFIAGWIGQTTAERAFSTTKETNACPVS